MEHSLLTHCIQFRAFRAASGRGRRRGPRSFANFSATPGLRGVLFDLPQVVSRASEVLTGDIADRCQIVGGDFFDSVPEGADAYILKGVIHDWPDRMPSASSAIRAARSARTELSSFWKEWLIRWQAPLA